MHKFTNQQARKAARHLRNGDYCYDQEALNQVADMLLAYADERISHLQSEMKQVKKDPLQNIGENCGE